MAMLLLGMNVQGQEWSTADLVPLVISCPYRPYLGDSPVTLTVDQAWVDESSSLFADLLVTNGSELAIRLPRRNVCQRYWGSRVDPIPRHEYRGRPMCGGDDAMSFPNDCNTLGLFGDPQEMLLAEEDIVTVAPGRTALLRAVYLDRFVPDSQDREHAVRSFEVFYTGRSKIEVGILPGKLAELKTALAEANAHECSLYGGALGGRGQFLIQEQPAPAPGDVEVIVINTQPWRD